MSAPSASTQACFEPALPRLTRYGKLILSCDELVQEIFIPCAENFH